MSGGTRITKMVRNACRFLLGGQEENGFWRDYILQPGPSREWVTAFVGYALAGADSDGASTEAIARALSAVSGTCRPTGWGYNAAVATDADTTSWVVRWFTRTATAIPLDPLHCLETFLTPEAGARTFARDPRYGCWTIEHDDVTPVLGLAMKEAGAGFPSLDRLRQRMLSRRNDDGLWSSFWWTFDAYATARNLEFLDATGGIPAAVADAARRSLQTMGEPATAMEAANVVMIASRIDVSPGAWICWLTDRQRANGSWAPSRVLQIPHQNGAPDAPAFEDVNAFMSTAMAIMALTQFMERDHDDA